MKLEIRIGPDLTTAEPVDLTTGGAVELKRVNPIFNKEEIEGDRAPNFTLPFSERNDRVLGRFRDPQVVGSRLKFYGEKYVDTHRIIRGDVKLHQAVSNYELYFLNNLADAFGDLRTRKLSEIDFGTVALPTNFNATLTNTWATGGYVLPVIENPDFYGQTPPGGFSGKVNDYASGYTSGVKVPMLFWKWVAEWIRQETGFTFTGDFWTHPLTERLLVYNTRSLDGATAIRLQDHLPDMTVGRFFVETAKLFDVAMFFDLPNRTLRMDFVGPILEAPCEVDWSQYCPRFTGKLPVAVKGLELAFSLDSGDATAKVTEPDFESYLTGGLSLDDRANVMKVTSAWSSLATGTSGLPFTRQQGITPTGKQDDKKFTPRLLLWHGLSGGVPLALNTWSTYDLAWNGPDGLAARFWALEEAWRRATFKTPPLRVYLPAREVAQYSPRRKVHLHGVNYLVDEFIAPLHDLRLGCQITAWKV